MEGIDAPHPIWTELCTSCRAALVQCWGGEEWSEEIRLTNVCQLADESHAGCPICASVKLRVSRPPVSVEPQTSSENADGVAYRVRAKVREPLRNFASRKVEIFEIFLDIHRPAAGHTKMRLLCEAIRDTPAGPNEAPGMAKKQPSTNSPRPPPQALNWETSAADV